MIGLGAKYITAAGFGRYRITAASLGRGWVMCPWLLSPSAKQAIMAAFGVDGTAVIAATNEYLNGIAASDKAKATALAGFINEDPMMVCSLGLEPQGVTMPDRWLVTDGNSYIKTGYTSETDEARFRVIYKQTGNTDSNTQIFGSQKLNQDTNWTLNPHYANGGMSFAIYLGSSTVIASYTNVAGTKYDFEAIIHANHTARLIMNGSAADKSWSGTICNNNSEIALFTDWNGSNFTTRQIKNYSISMFEIENNGVVKRHFVPYKHPTQGNGMLDLVNVVFYPNAGTGQFTIPDISYPPTTQPSL